MSSTRPSEPGYAVGVDVGTTLTKAVLFSADGTALRRAARPTVLRRVGPGRYEQDTDQVVTSVLDVLDELAPGPVTAVGITGQGDGLWLTDAAGRSVRPAISWLDGRAADVVAEWQAAGLLELAFRRTGSLPFAGCSGPLLAWLDRHEPAVVDRAATAAYCKDVVLQRLTGVRGTDVSDASVPFLDPARRDYDVDLLAACGLAHRRDLLAPVLTAPGGELCVPAGGMRTGTPVVAAPYDLPASAWGAGVDRPGDGMLIVGTTLACQVVTDRVPADTMPAAAMPAVTPAVTPAAGPPSSTVPQGECGEPAGLTLSTWEPGRWLRAMPAMVGTAGLDWMLGLLGAHVEDLATLLAAGDSAGLVVLPFFAEAGERAPFVAPTARARIDGLHTGVGPADLVRATCEAIAYSARHCLTAAGLTGELVGCGGGLRSRAWAQLFADVLGRPLRLCADHEVGARGAAQAALRTVGAPALPAAAGDTVLDPVGNLDDGYARYLDQLAHARTAWART